MWCIPRLTPEYVQRMENLLDLYEKPLNPREPVVCLDEKPMQLLQEARPPMAADRPGQILRRDNEYVRNGTANIFGVVEPKAGRHMAEVTPNRSGPAFAKEAARIARAYPEARTIHLVVDNLSTHSQKVVVDTYGKKRGKEIWNRFTVHPTPKHGSWLNQAEIELSLLSRQCLGHDRLGDIDLLRRRVKAWDWRANREKVKIDWRFTTKDAQEKFGYRSCLDGYRLSPRPAAFGLRLRRSSLAMRTASPRSSLLGSLQNRPAKTAIMSRSED
jgi:hypothetical protein